MEFGPRRIAAAISFQAHARARGWDLIRPEEILIGESVFAIIAPLTDCFRCKLNFSLGHKFTRERTTSLRSWVAIRCTKVGINL